MARRFHSTFLLLNALVLATGQSSREFPEQVVSGQGTGTNLEDRENHEYGYIPNYADEKCTPFITYPGGEARYNASGAKDAVSPGVPTESCCGVGNDRQACGPEYWVFSETTSPTFGGNSFFRCQPENVKVNTKGENNQQSPLNFQTITSHNNKALNFTDISKVPSVYPPADQDRVPTGFDFTNPSDQLFAFSGNTCPGTLKKLDGTWQVDFPAGSVCALTATIGKKTFRLAQFHLHSAEHTVNGMYYPLEIHMVHFEYDPVNKIDTTSKPLVLGAFGTASVSINSQFKKLINAFDVQKLAVTPLNPYLYLLPIKDSYWHYLGSLTSPPCQPSDTGYVRWFVFKKPILLSGGQAQYFSAYFNTLEKSYNGQNSRPVQKLLDITTLYSKGSNFIY